MWSTDTFPVVSQLRHAPRTVVHIALLAATAVISVAVPAPAQVPTVEQVQRHPGVLHVKEINAGAPGLTATERRSARALVTQLLAIVRELPEISTPHGYDFEIDYEIGDPANNHGVAVVPVSLLTFLFPHGYNTDTHQYDVSDHGLGPNVLVNDIGCVFNTPDGNNQGDSASRFYFAPKMTQRSPGEVRFGDGCVVLTHIQRPLQVPVSQERYLKALITAASERVADADRRASDATDPATAYREWVAERPKWEREMNATCDLMKERSPQAANKCRIDIKQMEKDKDAMLKSLMADSAYVANMAAIKSDTGEQRVRHDLEAELASLSPAERAAPSYFSFQSTLPSHLGHASDEGAEMVVVPNPHFFDRHLPRTTPQAIAIQGAVLPSTSKFYDPWEAAVIDRIREGLDRKALDALLRP